MVPILDNAPYHHKRQIGSLQGINKKKLLEMMQEDQVDTIDLPWSEARYREWNSGDERFEDAGEFVRVDFDPEEQIQRAGANRPHVATVQELQVAYLIWLRACKPSKLECEFEALMKSHGYPILWTPPYCPKLQPIEEFWGVGKGHVSRWFNNQTTMKDVIRRLRDGWSGNDDRLQPGEMEYTTGTRCERLIQHVIDAMDNYFIPIAPGITGRIGQLTIDRAHECDRSLVMDLTKGLEMEEE